MSTVHVYQWLMVATETPTRTQRQDAGRRCRPALHVGKRSRASVRENRTDKKRLLTDSLKGKFLYTRLET